MKKIAFFVSILLLLLALGACTLPMPTGEAPTAAVTEVPTFVAEAPTNTVAPTQPPPPTESSRRPLRKCRQW